MKVISGINKDKDRLLHPSHTGLAVLAVGIPDHVPAGEHGLELDTSILHVDHVVEEEGRACCTCKSIFIYASLVLLAYFIWMESKLRDL